MLDALLQESVELLEEDFYSKPFRFSYSSLSKLLYSPAVFYQMYVLGHKEEKITPSLLEGKVIHCLLLENNSFDKYFIVSPTNLPTGTAKTLVDNVYFRMRDELKDNPTLSFKDCENKILEVLKYMNYYQKITLDADRLAKVITTETSNYWDFLKLKGSKELIDQETLKYCTDAVEIIKLNPVVNDLLGMNVSDFDNVEVFNEEYMEADLPKYPFGLKGYVDNIKIDHDQKIIYINDFKTSGKSLKEFRDSVEFYNYWMQSVIYLIMVSQKYFHLLEKNYSIRFHFIVIDKYFNVYPFPVTEKTRMDWFDRLNKTLDIAKYHYTEKRFDLPYEFDTGSAVL